ncbi:hypothetical protein ACF05L_08690 [Streptomyces bobili]|uniref:hypothetical protein n=1 Tax=Streptomyces bobili TaxID=67280 RepID=UPI0036F57A74
MHAARAALHAVSISVWGEVIADVSTATAPTARSVRRGSERRTRPLTRTVFGTIAAFIAVTVLWIAS